MIKYFCNFCSVQLSKEIHGRNKRLLSDMLYKYRAGYLVKDNKILHIDEVSACDNCLAFIEKEMKKFDKDMKDFFANWKRQFKKEIKMHVAKTKTDKAKILLD